jgi:hypothetical protein
VPVTFKFSSHTPTNKPHPKLIDTAYTCLGDDGKIAGVVLKPKLDKLSVTFAIDCKDDQAGIKDLLFDVVKSPEMGGDSAFVSAPKYKGSPYQFHCDILVPDGKSKIFVAAIPKASSKAAFLRFEFNPDKLGPSGLAYFRSQLVNIFLDYYFYSDIAKKGKVTKLDIACDIIGIPISSLLFSTQKGGKSHIYYGDAGGVETVYLGIKKKKPSKLKLYDKAQQLQDVEGEADYGTTPHIRIEVTTNPMRSIVGLSKISKNPFLSLDVIRLGGVTPPEEAHHWVMFGDSCRQRGQKRALGILPDAVRPKYEAALAQAKGQLWKPDRLWNAWGETLAKSGLLDDVD